MDGGLGSNGGEVEGFGCGWGACGGSSKSGACSKSGAWSGAWSGAKSATLAGERGCRCGGLGCHLFGDAEDFAHGWLVGASCVATGSGVNGGCGGAKELGGDVLGA